MTLGSRIARRRPRPPRPAVASAARGLVGACGGAPLSLVALLLFASSCGGTSVSDADAGEEAEPSDGAIMRAVVSSMRAYYWRRATLRSPEPSGNREQQSHHHRRKRDEEVVCYEELGCFRDDGPFDYLDTLPQPPERIRTRFLLYTAKNPTHPVLMHYANLSSMHSALYNRTIPTKIMVHGFGSSCQKRWAIDIRKALLHAEHCNVICVDWEEGALLPNYVQAASNTRLVGKQLARFIQTCFRERGNNASSFHLIGFSLGAHVVGFAGHDVRNISRITGLDPAAPLFEGYSAEARLDLTDAAFVDVIHSNGESLLYGGLGAFEPMGHVDYYPNGGKVQAGCTNFFVGAISDLISGQQSRQMDGRSLCNHRRAYKFFADSVLPNCKFPAFACTDFEAFLRGDCFACGGQDVAGCGNMGYFADRSPGRGKMFLITRDTEPFCSNQYKVVIESSPGLAPTYGGLELTLINWNHLNETFQVTSEWEQLVSGKPLTRVIVASPAFDNIVSAQIKYAPYKGWITNGAEQWAVDRITVLDSFGRRFSFCRRGLPLAEGQPTTVIMSNEECSKLSPPPKLQAVLRPQPDDRPLVLAGGQQTASVKHPFYKKPIYQVAPPLSHGHPHHHLHRLKNDSDVIKMYAAVLDKGRRSNATKAPPVSLKSQVLYFQFFPLPSRGPSGRTKSNSSSTAGDDKRPRDGAVYDVERFGPGENRTPRFRYIPLRPSQSPAEAAGPFNAKIEMAGGRTSADNYRIGRNFGFNLDRSGGANAGPDIGAQIVFVPGGHHKRELYIPLRPLSEVRRSNSSRRLQLQLTAAPSKSSPISRSPRQPARPAATAPIPHQRPTS